MTSASSFRRLRAPFLVCLAMLACDSALAAPCRIEGKPWLSLSISAGALAPSVDRTSTVSVYANGCAHVHRPAYWRDAGDFRVALTTAQIDDLRRQIGVGSLQRFDPGAVRAALRTAQAENGMAKKSRGAELFTVSDADRYDFSWHDGKASGSASWNGLPQYAEAYPQITALQAFQAMASRLQDVVRRNDAVRVQAGAP